MTLGDDALKVLIDSVWSVSARQAFDDGFQLGVLRRDPEVAKPWKSDALAACTDIDDVSMRHVRDAVALKLADLRQTVHRLHDRANPHSSHGKSQRAVLMRLLLEVGAGEEPQG